MWEYNQEATSQEGAVKYFLWEKERKLTLAEVVALWKESEPFRRFYNAVLSESSFPAFFWEVPSSQLLAEAESFEFVLVNSDALKRIKADSSPFQPYFEVNEEVVSFPNLGKDAQLVVPCPKAEVVCYAHLAAFVRKAPEQQRDAFWQRIGEEYEKRMQEKQVWLSTAGLGVSWLHIRIDSRPKYYRYAPYREEVG